MLFCNRKIIFDHFCYRYCSACMFQNTSFVFINTKSCSKIWLCLRNRENDKGLYATMIGGEMNLSAQDCCVERNYWLGSDGVLYKAGVLGMDSWEYANLKSHVRMGWYGARVNINLLGLFHKATVTCKPCWATSPT